jgi:hypothetical protein
VLNTHENISRNISVSLYFIVISNFIENPNPIINHTGYDALKFLDAIKKEFQLMIFVQKMKFIWF